MRRAPIAVLAVFAAGIAVAAPGFVPVEVTIRPIDEFTITDPENNYGTISFRGGFALSSGYQHFGALSGLEITPDGTLVAIADTGFWLTARLVESDGWLTGITDVAMAPLLDADGEEANRKASVDAEGLRLSRDRTSLLVSFEGDHRVARYPLAGDLGLATPTPVALPSLQGISANRGIEAVAVAPTDGPLAGATVIIAESARDSSGNSRAWVVDGPRAGAFSVRERDGFDITDAAFLPNGDLFILERRFSLSQGIAMRIRRLAGADIRPGATVDGPTVLFDDHLFQIDNMEGMVLRPQPTGDVMITLVSDDNHSLLQRTILLQFLWRETIPPLPPVRP